MHKQQAYTNKHKGEKQPVLWVNPFLQWFFVDILKQLKKRAKADMPNQLHGFLFGCYGF